MKYLTINQVKEIKQLLLTGLPTGKVASVYNINIAVVQLIRQMVIDHRISLNSP